MCGSKAITSLVYFACSLMHLARHAGKVSVHWGVSQNQASSSSPLRQKKNLVCAVGWRSWVPAHDDARLISGNGPTEQTDGHGQQDQQLECVFRISCPIIPPFKLRLEWVDAAEYVMVTSRTHSSPSLLSYETEALSSVICCQHHYHHHHHHHHHHHLCLWSARRCTYS